MIFSIPWVRNRVYESFYWTHFLLAIVYIGLCFWHFGNLGDSWLYLWATLGIWLVNMLGRIFFKTQAFRLTDAWPTVFPTQLSALPGGMTRVDVTVPEEMKWSPGQHCYLRFPGLAIWDNHPFTIASFPTSDEHEDEGEKDGALHRRLTFFIRAHQGFTKKLAVSTQAKPGASTLTHVWLDGPYGGAPININEAKHDNVTLIAGGSGITACLSWLSHLAQKTQNHHSHDQGNVNKAKINLLWVVRQRAHTAWISAELEMARTLLGGEEKLAVSFYVTDTPRGKEERKEGNEVKIEEAEKGVKSAVAAGKDDEVVGTFHDGRPFIPTLLPEILGEGRNLVVGGCLSFPPFRIFSSLPLLLIGTDSIR